jgi:hypothetical protein
VIPSEWEISFQMKLEVPQQMYSNDIFAWSGKVSAPERVIIAGGESRLDSQRDKCLGGTSCRKDYISSFKSHINQCENYDCDSKSTSPRSFLNLNCR